MFHCPFCRHASHARTSSYLSENVKRRYHQCRNIECSATFRTTESVDGVIRPAPGAGCDNLPGRVNNPSQTLFKDHGDNTVDHTHTTAGL